ncbi:hypothetical protein [Streptococcus suis]
MTNKANNILVDYEGLCCQLTDILEVLVLANQGYDPKTTNAIINTSYRALKSLISEHDTLTAEYRKELTP